MAVSTGRRGIDRKRWRATRRAVLARGQYRCRQDELAAGAPGEAGKGPLPKRPGRDLYRAAADRRNPTRRPSGRIAGNRTEPAGARPPHSCERLTRLRPAVNPPDVVGIGAAHVPSFGPGLVHVSGSAPGPAPTSVRGSRRHAKTILNKEPHIKAESPKNAEFSRIWVCRRIFFRTGGVLRP